MDSRIRLLILLTTVVLTFAVSLSAEEVVRDFDRSFDFSQLKTYRWMDVDKRLIARANPQTAAELSNEKLDQVIRSAVDEQLKKRGFTLVTNGAADFLATYFAVGQMELSGSFYDAAPSGTMPYNHWRPFYEPSSDARLNTRGTLTLDFVDPGTEKLIWRGQAGDTIKKVKDIEKGVRKVTKKILSKFPPKS